MMRIKLYPFQYAVVKQDLTGHPHPNFRFYRGILHFVRGKSMTTMYLKSVFGSTTTEQCMFLCSSDDDASDLDDRITAAS
jgi:hypothetical protein